MVSEAPDAHTPAELLQPLKRSTVEHVAFPQQLYTPASSFETVPRYPADATSAVRNSFFWSIVPMFIVLFSFDVLPAASLVSWLILAKQPLQQPTCS